MFRSVFLFCCIFVAATGYNFNDADFNELLMHDFLDAIDIFGSESDLTRAKRDVQPPPPNNDKCEKPWKGGPDGFKIKCCDDQIFNETVREKSKMIKRECFAELRKSKTTDPASPAEQSSPDMFTCGGAMKGRKEMTCVMECVAKKQNLLDDSGNIIPSALSNHVKNELFNIDWAKNAADDFVTKCIADSSKPDANGKATDEMKCSKQPIKFVHCMFKELNNACPKDKQKNTEKCKKLREKLNSGDDFDVPPSVEDVEDNL